MPPDSDARGLYPHVGSRTRPVLYRSETGLTHAAAAVGADPPEAHGTERLDDMVKAYGFFPLASPEGKLAWQIIGTSEPIIYHD